MSRRSIPIAALNSNVKGVSSQSNLGAVKSPRSFYFKCSVPPTANHMHTVARGRKIKSAEYRKWLDATAWDLNAQAYGKKCLRGTRLDVPVAVKITLPRLHALSDLDNRIKPILDALQNGGIIANDNLVHAIDVSWRPKSYQDQELAWVTVSELT